MNINFDDDVLDEETLQHLAAKVPEVKSPFFIGTPKYLGDFIKKGGECPLITLFVWCDRTRKAEATYQRVMW